MSYIEFCKLNVHKSKYEVRNAKNNKHYISGCMNKIGKIISRLHVAKKYQEIF